MTTRIQSVPRIDFRTITIAAGSKIRLSDFIPFDVLEWWQVQVEPTVVANGFIRIGDRGVITATTGVALTSGQTFPPFMTPHMTAQDIHILNSGTNPCQINVVFQPACDPYLAEVQTI